MKNSLDKTSNKFNLKDPLKQPYPWAKGFKVRGKTVFHPYTLHI